MMWFWRVRAWFRWNIEWYAKWDAIHNLHAANIRVGDRYEDCGYKTRTATSISYSQDILWGVDADGNVGSCSPTCCGVELVL